MSKRIPWKIFPMLTVCTCLSLLFLNSCQTVKTSKVMSGAETTDFEQLEQRVYEYMNYRMKNDLKGMYNLVTPEVKKRISPFDFKPLSNEFTVGLLAYYIQGIEFIDSKTAVVFISEYVRVSMIPTPVLRPAQETRWVKIDGQWYFDRDFAEKNLKKMRNKNYCGRKVPIEKSGNIGSACGR